MEKTTFSIESHISVENVQRLEQAIDEINASLPSLASFILPGGSYPASVCHVCRTVCRRAERRIQALEESLSYELEEQAKCFVNRLSDYLFVLSRRLNNLTYTMYWTLELASKLEDAPWPATKDELIDYAMRSGAPLEVIENLQEMEDEGEIYESIEDIWPDYPSKEDFFFNEEEY